MTHCTVDFQYIHEDTTYKSFIYFPVPIKMNFIGNVMSVWTKMTQNEITWRVSVTKNV